jgi:hypothetical protein
VIVAQRARQPDAYPTLPDPEGLLLHQPDPEPTRQLCPHCLRPVIHATLAGREIIADLQEWLPRGECLSCAHTRHAHPGTHVECRRCNGSAMVGTARPPGQMLAIDVAWGDTIHLRVIGENTDRRRGEALYPLHVCSERYDWE